MTKIVEYDTSLPTMTDMVKAILIDTLPKADGNYHISMNAVDQAKRNFDFEGPYGMAKRLCLLVEGSGEDMAIEFMTFINEIYPQSY